MKIFLLFFLLFVGALSAPAQLNLTVDTIVDDAALTACTDAPNDCSLRGAISSAPAGANITFGVTGTIEVTSPAISIAKDLTITGPGAGSLTLSGNGNDSGFHKEASIFNISSGIVGISGLTLRDGTGEPITDTNGNTYQTYGGAIYMTGGTVTVTGSTLSNNNNYINYGGAVYIKGGSLTVTSSTISNNNIGSYNSGGGIAIIGGSVAVTNSTISGNGAGFGGGIYSAGGLLNLSNSTISGNFAQHALRYETYHCVTSSESCVNPLPGFNCHGTTTCDGFFSVNGRGGGIFNTGGTVNITNSTISGNIVEGYSYSSEIDYGGGGIDNRSTMTIANSTITNNSGRNDPGQYGGGIQNRGTLNLSNSIIAGNSASGGGPDIYNFPGGSVSGNYNLMQNGSPISGTNNITGQDAKLGALANNGGQTQTHMLLAGSPAIDAGDPNFDQTNTPYDQRGAGFPRVYNGRVDIGAYESGNSFIVNTLADHDDGFCDVTDCTLREAVKIAATGANITFSVTGTITLMSGELAIDKNLTITGPATAPGITVSGGGVSRIFSIGTFGTFGTSNTVTFSNLTLSGGNGVGSGTQSGFGGAIYIVRGVVTVANSTLSGNNATSNGTAASNGGAIRNGGNLTITNSTFFGNNATGTGGAIQNGGNLTVTNSTISGNTATGGGGIFTVTSTNTTRNLSNSIVAGNSATTGPDINGIVTAGDYNLVQNISGATLPGTHNVTGQTPQLEALKIINSEPTATMALLADSPAIDAGDPNFDAVSTPFDQRGSSYARRVGSSIDIGAFEVQSPDSTTATAINSQPQNQTVCETTAANFSVGAIGESLTYQWRKGGVNLIDGNGVFGATLANLTINSAAAIDAGNYDVVVSGSNGTATSEAATLSVNSAPAITAQPIDQSVNSGANASFTAAASGAQTIQWQISTDGGTNFTDIGGATAGTLTLSAVTSAQSGSKYRAIFSGACGNPATSGAATLTVGKVAQTITFDAIADKTYGDAPFALAASATSNLPVNFSIVSGSATVSGNTLTITGAGAVTVRAAQSGDNQYNAASSVEQSFIVGKAQAAVTLSNLSQTYNGTAKAATTNSTPANLNLTLTYSQNGVTIAQPTNAGSYTVAANVSDANYQGTATDTLRIAKATPVITWNNPADITYGTKLGAAQLNATTSTAGNFNYNPAADTLLGAGANQSLATTFTPTDANNYATVNRSVAINVTKANQTITFANLGTKTFGDADFNVSASSDSDLTIGFAAAGNCSVINGSTVHITGAGSCEITASQSGSGNYNAADSVTRTFAINQATQTINFGALSNKYIGNGGIVVSATGGNSGNPVTFASGTTSVCTSGGTNGATITFIGLGTCTITASQNGSGNYGAANGVSRSFSVNADSTTVTLDLSGHSFINFDCAADVISATVRDGVTGAWIQNATVNFVVGSQTISATTDANGKASAAIVLNQQPGTITVSADYAGSGYNLAGSASATKTISASANVGPGLNASSFYTGSLYYWTTNSTSGAATLTLSATLKDTLANCPGDITKAKVSFQISTNGGNSFSPISGAQNLPVGLINPADPTTGAASAIAQYNIGNAASATITIRVVVGGEYKLDTAFYDVPVTIGRAGQANSLMGGGQIKNDGNQFPANGFLGLNSTGSTFGGQVAYNNKGTNPQGQVQIYIDSYNDKNGNYTPDVLHKYFIKSNSISELSTVAGSASFGSKTNVYELKTDGTKESLDGGGTMQIVFTPNGKQIPGGMYLTTNTSFSNANGICTNQQGCMSITAYKSSGGLWYSSSWGQSAGTNAPHTYVKAVLPGGAIAVQ